jgi:hypothetical protein
VGAAVTVGAACDGVAVVVFPDWLPEDVHPAIPTNNKTTNTKPMNRLFLKELYPRIKRYYYYLNKSMNYKYDTSIFGAIQEAILKTGF